MDQQTHPSGVPAETDRTGVPSAPAPVPGAAPVAGAAR